MTASRNHMEARYLNPESVVVYLSLPSLKALYGLVARKQIPYTRLGNRTLRFSRVDLDLWLTQRTTKPMAKAKLRSHGHKDEDKGEVIGGQVDVAGAVVAVVDTILECGLVTGPCRAEGAA